MSNNLPSHGNIINSLDPLTSLKSNHHIRNSSATTTTTATSNSSLSTLLPNMPANPNNPSASSSSSSSSLSLTSSNNINGPLPDNEYKFPYCEDVNKYTKICKIGQGTFGEVFKARHGKGKKFVALKKVLMENEKEGFPITALREIKILQLIKHENVVNLIEICRTSSNDPNYKATFYLVFDFCDHDLAGLLSNLKVKFNLGEIKKVMQQLLNGLYYIHKQKILHRDMKAANILITKTGVLKLADFGLARATSDTRSDRYTNRVVTLWYRPPELLLGARNYGPPIDLWGAGCIMAEMWTRSPILQGSTELAQLQLITQLCGSITPEVWPDVNKLELYNKMELAKNQRRIVKEKLKIYIKCDYALDLLDKLLILDPSKRLDSDSALNHDFFWCDPMPQDLGKLLSQCTNSMFEFTTARRRTGVTAQQGGGPQAPGPHPYHPGGHHLGGHQRGHPQGRMGGPQNAGGGQYIDRVF